ncbi:hypothetical protein BASA83_006037 [Batrachochytrium salamandrivorans]|nr:hypothetical protein BASA83_006037 [Batrachochytrium salamandrivorans]
MLHPDTPPDPQPGDEVEDKVNGGVELPTNSHEYRRHDPYHYSVHSSYQPPLMENSDDGSIGFESPNVAAAAVMLHGGGNAAPLGLTRAISAAGLPRTDLAGVDPIPISDSSPGQAYDDILSTPPFAFEKTAVQLPSAFQEYIHNEPADINDIEATNDENAVQKHHIRFEQRLSRQPSYATSNASFSLSPHQQSHSPQPFLPLHHLPSQQSHLPHNIAAFEAFSDYTQHLDGHFTPIQRHHELIQQQHLLQQDQHYAMDDSMPAMNNQDFNNDSDSEAEAPDSIQFEARPSDSSTVDMDHGLDHRLTTSALLGDHQGGSGRGKSGQMPLHHHQNQRAADFPPRPVFGLRPRDQPPPLPTNTNRDASRDSPGTTSRLNGDGPNGTANGHAYSAQRRSGWSPGITSWKDVRHLDPFLTRIYEYYCGKGYFCIALVSLTNIASAAFIISISTFLLSCVKYELIHEKKTAIGCVWLILQIGLLITDFPRLREMQLFFTNVLDIPDDKLQNTLWSDVVVRIIETRDQYGQTNPAAVLRRLNAHAIANRILRKDNYMIALFNKDILDLSAPFLGSRQIMSKLMEWNLSYCVFSYVFDEKGMFHKRFLKESNRKRLVEGLQRRFRNMAMLNLVLSPFLLIFLVVYSLFKFAEEYQRNPSGLSARQYSPFAWWKFREFNELPHLLKTRLYRSTESANTYIRQFPKQSVVILAKFVSFIFGSLGAILLALTLFEEELQQGFDISPGRSTFFYIGIFGSIMALSRSLVPPETEVYEPERWMREVAIETHYLPAEWRDRAHTDKVRGQFGEMYDYKIVLWLFELLSVVLAPMILYYSLPQCAPATIDFFREFTVHVDSLGYVCSFAVFDFKRHGNVKFGTQTGTRNEELVSKEGKMEMSFLNFKANNPSWDPGLEGSEYISRILAHRREHGMMRPSNLANTAMLLQGSMNHSLNPHQRGHDFMASTTFDSSGLHADGGIHRSDMMESYLRGESMVQKSQLDARQVGRELVGILDAIYEAHRRMI